MERERGEPAQLDDKGVCTAARVAIGAVAPTALLVAPASAALVGTKVDDAAIEKLVAAVRAACKPIDDKRGTKEFRIEVTGVLASAWRRLRSNGPSQTSRTRDR